MLTEIEKLKEGLVKRFNPEKILLFGSQADETVTDDSDIDICIIADVHDQKAFERDINLYIYDADGLDFDKPVDIILYTPHQWEECLKDSHTFASMVAKKGVVLYGRQ